MICRHLRCPPASGSVHWARLHQVAPTFLSLWAHVRLLDNSSLITLYELVSPTLFPFIFSTLCHFVVLYIVFVHFCICCTHSGMSAPEKKDSGLFLLYLSYLVHSWCLVSICWMNDWVNEWFIEWIESSIGRSDRIIQLRTFKCPQDFDPGWCIATLKNSCLFCS